MEANYHSSGAVVTANVTALPTLSDFLMSIVRYSSRNTKTNGCLLVVYLIQSVLIFNPCVNISVGFGG